MNPLLCLLSRRHIYEANMAFFKLFKGKEIVSLGQVEALQKSLIKTKVNVHKLSLEDGTTGVGLNIISKGFLASSSFPISLNELQAKDLVSKINQALSLNSSDKQDK